jgi:cytochrome c553/6-phosphogluconolactonase (cycloisomerase 2 family)
VVVDSESGKVVQRIDVFDEPYGIVSDAAGRYLYATLEYPGQVIRVDTTSWQIDQAWDVGSMLRGIAWSEADQNLFVTEYLTAALIQISAEGEVQKTFAGVSTDNLARQVTLHPSRPKALVPHVRSKITAAHGNGSIFPYVSVVSFDGEVSGRRLRIPMDTFRGTRVVANPWEAAFAPDGRQAYVVFSGTNDLYVADVQDDDYQELTYAATLRVGSNPRAVKVTPDGQTLLVYNALDFDVTAYELPSLKLKKRLQVTQNPLSEEHLLGKKLFYTALQPMSGRQWIACSSCHIDGDADGRTWQQPEGLRQTQPLNGLAWTHPLHWSADRDEVQDFEHTIRGKLMQGRGLLQGNLPDAMADRIGGRSELLDALAVYTNSHRFTLSPHAKDGLSEAAARGRAIFESAKTGCATCHSGPYYCDSQPGAADQLTRHDVGTGQDDPSELMGTRYDTPTLLGVYRSAPYLHDGTAATLKDVLTTQNKEDRHGTTSHLTEQQIDDLVAFLKALPFEDPEQDPRSKDLTRVDR